MLLVKRKKTSYLVEHNALKSPYKLKESDYGFKA